MSKSIDDYMKTIFELGGHEKRVTNKAIGEVLGVSGASVTEMITKLQLLNLIDYKPYKGVYLTDEGNIFAARIVRRHRLWEVFLFNELDYSWEDVHDEAEDLEHHVSELFMDRLEKYLNYPTYCPHGGAIPKKDGNMPAEAILALADLNKGDKFELARVSDDKELLIYLSNQDMAVSKNYRVVEKETYGDGFILENDDNSNSNHINAKASHNIFVKILT